MTKRSDLLCLQGHMIPLIHLTDQLRPWDQGYIEAVCIIFLIGQEALEPCCIFHLTTVSEHVTAHHALAVASMCEEGSHL